MLLSSDLGDFARPICKTAQMCARAIHCGRATKSPVWHVASFVEVFQSKMKSQIIDSITDNFLANIPACLFQYSH